MRSMFSNEHTLIHVYLSLQVLRQQPNRTTCEAVCDHYVCEQLRGEVFSEYRPLESNFGQRREGSRFLEQEHSRNEQNAPVNGLS
jgi:hypothetical protein